MSKEKEKNLRPKKQNQHVYIESDMEDDSDVDPLYHPFQSPSLNVMVDLQQKSSAEHNILLPEPSTSRNGLTISSSSSTKGKANDEVSTETSTNNPDLSPKAYSKAKSRFTDYFEMTGPKNEMSAKCLLCKGNKKFKMSDRSTSSLQRHLKNKHHEAFKKIYPEKAALESKGQMSLEQAFSSRNEPKSSSSKLSKPMVSHDNYLLVDNYLGFRT